jgi:hypothetical protein
MNFDKQYPPDRIPTEHNLHQGGASAHTTHHPPLPPLRDNEKGEFFIIES